MKKKLWLRAEGNVWSLCPNPGAGDGKQEESMLHRLDRPVDFGAGFAGEAEAAKVLNH